MNSTSSVRFAIATRFLVDLYCNQCLPIIVTKLMTGCIAGANVNGADLESDTSVTVKRQNVVNGCPCLQNHCLHGGTCVNAMPPYCICPPGWTGPRCETIVTQPLPGM
jgi:hypothetical protein